MIKTRRRMIKLNLNMIILFIAYGVHKLLLCDKSSVVSFKCKVFNEGHAMIMKKKANFCPLL